MSPTTHRIFALNNTGIKNLQRGFFAEAVRSFRMAMQCLTDKMHVQTYDEFLQEQQDCQEEEQMPVYPVPLVTVDASTILQASPHNALELYQTAFLFAKMDDSHLAQDLQSEISAILLYNLAVTHHLAGLARQECSAENLEQAMHYYKLSMTIFKSHSDLQFDDSCFTVVLGILANMGHIFVHFAAANQAAVCLQRMEEILDSGAAGALSDDDGDFFFSALTYSAAQPTMPAAAA